MPEFANSVIPCGINGLLIFLILSYKPISFEPPYSLAKPEILVESARSALIAITKGLPYLLIDNVLI